jgi:hypothetical protein
MSSDDIANLYRQFGGSADNYKELGRDNVVRQSRERWPLLATVRAQDATRPVRPVVPGEVLQSPAPGAFHPAPMAMVFDESATARAAADARARALDVAPAEPVAPPAARPVQQVPVEPVFTAPLEPIPEWVQPAPPIAAPVPVAPVAAVEPSYAAVPAAHVAPQAAHAPAGTELQGLFARLARPVEPAAPVDRSGSLLKRLLKP